MKVNLAFPVSISVARGILMAVLVAYVVLAFGSLFFGSPLLRGLSGITGLAFIVLFVLLYRVRLWFSVGLVCALLAVRLLQPVPELASSVFFVSALVSCFCISVLMRDFDLGLLGIKIPFFLLIFYVAFLWLVKGFSPDDFNAVFSGYSRNGVGAVILALMAGYVWYCYEKDVHPSLFLVFLGFLLMVPLYGRANIFFGALVLGLAFNYKFGSASSFFLSLILVVFLIVFSGVPSDYFTTKTNFSSGLESPRIAMLADYWGALDFKFLFLGGDLYTMPTIAEYEGNPHNAFLRAHAFFGIFALLLFFVFLLPLFISMFFGNWMVTGLGLVFLGRAFLDIIYLGNIFDYLMLGPFIYYFRPKMVDMVAIKYE